MNSFARRMVFAGHILRETALAFSRPGMIFYILPWLMFLLTAGTIAQRRIGLYQSQKLFFDSFIFWLGPLPLPGAYITLGMIALCLIAKLALASPWKKHHAGIIVTHLSVLILLTGALITTLHQEEGYMILGPNDTENVISDYHRHELAIMKNGKVLLAVPQRELRAGAILAPASLPFSLRIDFYCPHCAIKPREHADTRLRGMAAKSDIVAAPMRKEDAENQPGMVFKTSGLSAPQDGIYIVSEIPSLPSPVFVHGKDRYEIVMRPEERNLPFFIRLVHFDKSDYPGTDLARNYGSEVVVSDGGIAWNANIAMNRPLRYRGYTLYQSSFLEQDGRFFTVLAVVKNAGAFFPYIAMAMLCAGLLLHLGIKFVPGTEP